MTTDIFTTKIESKYSQGEERTFEDNDHRVVVFIGKIGKDDKEIIKHNEFRLHDADAGTSENFDSFEKAIERYFECESHNKVLYQKRTVHGTADESVVTYRWN